MLYKVVLSGFLIVNNNFKAFFIYVKFCFFYKSKIDISEPRT